MKGLVLIIPAAVLAMTAGQMNVYAQEEPEISAKAAAVISADTYDVVYSHNSGEKLPMASTTKIMSALLCLESGDLDEEFVVDSDAIHVEGSSMGLQEGDIVTKYALSCGMLLPSGNDAANAAAVRIGGSIEGFVGMMNSRAREMGLSKTFFVTPSGLEGEGHGSSAYDMAVLASEALKNEMFREICSSTSIQLEYGNPPYKRWLKNTNKLLSLYSGTYGVKTGFTDEAGRCLVSACERDGKHLICVTLNDRNDWNDHMALYDYCFVETHLQRLELPENMTAAVAGSDKESISLYAEEIPEMTFYSSSPEDIEYQVIAPPYTYAPVNKGDEAAELSIILGGRELKRIKLYAAEDAEHISKQEDQSLASELGKKLRRLFSGN